MNNTLDRIFMMIWTFTIGNA